MACGMNEDLLDNLEDNLEGNVDDWDGKPYVYYESENYDKYLKICGIETSEFGMNACSPGLCPIIKLCKDEDEYSLTYLWPGRNITLNFKLGEVFKEITIDGRRFKTVMTMKGNKLIQYQRGKVKGAATITREFSATEVKEIIQAGDIICTRKYKKP